MEDLELFDLDGEDIDAAEDANYISSADDGEEEEAPETAAAEPALSEIDLDETEDSDPSAASSDSLKGAPEEEESDTDTGEETDDGSGVGSMFPIRTSEGLIHQERRRRPRREVDPEEDEQHPDYAITLTKGVTNRPVKRIFLPHARAQLLAVCAFILAVALLCFLIFSVIYIVGNQRLKVEQAREVEMYRAENESLIADNTELRSKVNQLSVSVNRNLEDRRSEEAAYEASFLPRGYPLSQTTQMEIVYLDTDGNLYPSDAVFEDDLTQDETNEEADTEEEDAQEEENRLLIPADAMPLALFTTDTDLYVLAAGTGVVTRILPDPNFGTMLTIDHRNGYSSIYRMDGEVLVDVGDMVSRGDRLFSVTETQTETLEEDPFAEADVPAVETHMRLGYQIHLNDSYLNPEDFIEING